MLALLFAEEVEEVRAFNTAWDLLKIDEGMWEEIYAPLLAETTGMGKQPFAQQVTDFVPTPFAMDIKRDFWLGTEPTEEKLQEHYDNELNSEYHSFGDHGWFIDDLVESILEHGFTNQGAKETGREDPSFRFTPTSIGMFEGNHRLQALKKLGAPYVPFMGLMGGRVMTTHGQQRPHTLPFGDDFQEMMDFNQPYSIGDYMERGRIAIPPSFLYGREMVPNMGRLVPVNRLGEPIDLFDHIDENREYQNTAIDAMLARNKREPLNPFDDASVARNQRLLQMENARRMGKRDWMKEPSWKVVFD